MMAAAVRRVERYKRPKSSLSETALGPSVLLCGVAGFILASFPTGNIWDRDYIEVSVSTLREDENIENVLLHVDNVAREDHANAISQRHRQGIRQRVNLGNFWQYRKIIYPFLDFGWDVEGQITEFNDSDYTPVLNRLDELNEACIEWMGAGGAEPKYKSKVTGESASTMQQYSTERTFRGADGSRKVFEKHARIGGSTRIYFIPCPEKKRLEIGYIGKRHLPSVLFPT